MWRGQTKLVFDVSSSANRNASSREGTRADASRPSIRSLARQLGLSVATVSEALRNSPSVAAETGGRIRTAARAAGYVANPMIGAVLSSVRRRVHVGYHGTIAAINFSETPRPKMIPFHALLLSGAQERARQLGFKVDLFWFGPGVMSLPRLNEILRSRGVAGVFVLPFAKALDLSELDWSRFAGVSMDFCLSRPLLHSVLPDHHSSLFHALRELRQRGYRRPGLALVRGKDERLKFRWRGGYLADMVDRPAREQVPILMREELTCREFVAWVRRHRPDIVIGHRSEIIQWLRGAGFRVPRDIGFFSLNWTERTKPSAGLDLSPAPQGAIAIENVIAQLHRNERGAPPRAMTITVEAPFMDGPTIRAK
ncbi:MAG: LacI family transcriptional regulator [Verrucomicrobia bacterium]|nr:LacI family transcriptional regulator [Verrucomicrobiota bacterium]